MRTITRLLVGFLVLVAGSITGNSGESRSFEGVTATFRIEEPVIKLGDKLKVGTVYHNTSFTTVKFRFLDPTEDAEIFRKGEREPLLGGCSGEPAVQETILKPSESAEFHEEVQLTCWDDLTPGDYEIRFSYHLGVLADESLRQKYQREYPHDQYVVLWNDQRYQFTITQ